MVDALIRRVSTLALVLAALLACKANKSTSATDAKPVAGADVLGRACRLHNPKAPAADIGVFPSAAVLQSARDARDDPQRLKVAMSQVFVVGAHERCVILGAQYMDFATAREVEIRSGAHAGKRGWVFYDWALTEPEWSAAGLAAPFDGG